MLRLLVLCLAAVVLAQPAGETKTKILLISRDNDHPPATHEYMFDCGLLAKCLKQTPGIEAIVSNGWPKNADALKDVKAIVFYKRNGGNVLFDPFNKAQAEALLKNGVGLTAIHWGTSADKKAGEPWLDALGGWYSTDFSKCLVRSTKLIQADPKHPICRGGKEYELRDEYYIQLRFKDAIKPILKVEIDKKEYTVDWTYERPESKGGRSFGCVLGHFHSNFGEKQFRQALVNGILWTAHREVPEARAPVAITAKDVDLPGKK